MTKNTTHIYTSQDFIDTFHYISLQPAWIVEAHVLRWLTKTFPPTPNVDSDCLMLRGCTEIVWVIFKAFRNCLADKPMSKRNSCSFRSESICSTTPHIRTRRMSFVSDGFWADSSKPMHCRCILYALYVDTQAYIALCIDRFKTHAYFYSFYSCICSII